MLIHGKTLCGMTHKLLAQPVIEPGPSEYVIRDNEQLEIPCKATGRPAPTITWTKENRPLFLASPEYALQVSFSSEISLTCGLNQW